VASRVVLSSIELVLVSYLVVGLERSPLSLVSAILELLGRKNGGSGLENRECDRRDPSR
jgi:hypothetical protein